MVNLPTRAILEEVLVLRPDNFYVVPIQIFFNFKEYDSLEIDLDHINKNGRSDFTSSQVERVLRRMLHGSVQDFQDFKRYFGGDYMYYSSEVETGKLNYKVAFCICTDRPKRIGVMTIYRIRIRK